MKTRVHRRHGFLSTPQVIVPVPVAPTAEIDGPYSALTTGSVTLNYSQSHDPEGTGKYHWSLDPGNGSPLQTGAGASPFTISYQYPVAGTYTAKFSITSDSSGLTSNVDQTQVTITQPVLTVASVTL